MSSVERSTLFSRNDFSYPTGFDVARYREFERRGEWHFERGNHRFDQYVGNYGAASTPRQALIRYAMSPAGAWHTGQRARYPILHAELDPELVNIEDPSELLNLKQDVLSAIAHPFEENFHYQGYISPSHRYGHQGFDFHPLGHMAQVAISLDKLLMLNGASDSIVPDPFLIQALRHSSALHDLDEAEFPGIVLHHGSVIGDIGADRGKTVDDRRKGKAILTHLIKTTYHNVYSDEFSDTVIALASHDEKVFDKKMRAYHAAAELNHELNTLSTAKYLARKALEITDTLPIPSFLMTAIASDSITRGIKKRDILKDEGLTPELSLVLTEKLRTLFYALADRDEDVTYTSWRNHPAVEMRFGPFKPSNQLVQNSLDE